MKNKWLWLLPFILTLFVGWYQINASGETWDEQYRYITGRRYISNFLHLDFSYDSWGWQFEHPAVSRYPYGIAAIFTEKFFPKDPSYLSHNLTFARMVSVAQMAIAAVFIFLLGRLMFSSQIGLLASIIFALLPDSLAFSRTVSHEAPLLMYSSITFYYFIKALKDELNSKYFIWMGVFLGLALSTRFSNFLLIVLLPISYFIYKWKETIKKKIFSIPLNFFLAFLIAGGLFYALWPWLWPAPFDRLVQSLNFWREQGIGEGKHTLLYYFNYFLVTTPVLILLLNALFIYRFIRERTFNLTFILLMFLFQFLFSITAYQQGGFRYVALTLIPISLMSSLGLEYLVSLMSGRFKNINLFSIFGFLVVIYLSIIAVRFFPHYLDYYNEAVGGPNGVRNVFPVGVWGNGEKQAIDWVNRNAPSGSSVQLAVTPDFAAPPLRIDLKNIPRIRSKLGLPADFKEKEGIDYYTDIPSPDKRAEYLVCYGMGLNITPDYREVYRVTVDNYPIAKVYQRDMQ